MKKYGQEQHDQSVRDGSGGPVKTAPMQSTGAERPRRDSNPRITDLQSVPLSHLGTRPGRTRIPRAGCKGNVAWFGLLPNIGRRPHSANNRQNQTVFRCARVVRTMTSPWYSPGTAPPGQLKRSSQPGMASGEGSIMTVLPGIWGKFTLADCNSKGPPRCAAAFPAQTLDLVERQPEGVLRTLGDGPIHGFDGPPDFGLNSKPSGMGKNFSTRFGGTFKSGTNPTEEGAPLVGGRHRAPDFPAAFASIGICGTLISNELTPVQLDHGI